MKTLLIAILLLVVAVPLCADGFIIVPNGWRIHPPPRPRPHIRPRPDFTPFPLEVVYHHVDVAIDGQMSVTSIDQEFYNPTSRQLEGYYIFPLPKNAVIKKFSMYIDGKETEAELLDATKARRIYEDIVRRQRDPALLEYSGQGLFKARIFPIPPRSKKRVKISYRQLLPKDNNTIEYLYPLNTEKFSAKPLKDVSIRVTVRSPENIKNIYCPTHKAEISRKGKHKAVVGYEARNTKPDRDFVMYYTTDNQKLGFSLLTYKKHREDGYFFLSLSPGFSSSRDETAEKDIVFVLDSSGSMAGPKMRQAKKALLFCVENLNKGDRFEIIRFSTEAEALFRGFETASEKNRQEARDFIDNLKAIGGTNMDEALDLALKMKKRPGRPCMVIFLSDGRPTIGETDENNLVRKIKKANESDMRIFTFGIGHEVNIHLLDKITELTRAYRSYITPEEDIEIKVSNFYSKVQSPVMTDIKLDFGRNIRISKTYPRDLPDLFKGSSLMVLGRYKGSGDADIVVTGQMGNKEKRIRFTAPGAFKGAGDRDMEKNDFIPALWAARRVGYLLDQIRLHGKDRELVDEVTMLARTYGIITPYTSYLIVEDEKNNIRRRRIRPEDQTLGRIAERDRGFESRNSQEYAGMKSKSGAPGVKASVDVRQLRKADNFAAKVQGESRLNFRDKKGEVRNLAREVKNIQGRAVYNTGKFWVDSQVQLQRSQKINRIQFAGKDYFALLKKEPQAAQFMALGQNVRFVLNETIYEIYE
ncbi:MAG: VWA domain-containing protein [bacterium]|nr:VWA domain-containing protein [bacterium]